MALVDAQGLVIAHPDSGQLVRSAPGGGPHVTRIGDLADAALGPLFDAEVPSSGELSLRVGGRAWIGMKRPIAAHAGDPLILLLAAPRAELVAQARGVAQRQLVIGLGVLGLTLGLVWLFARRISRPLEDVTRSVAEIGRGNLEAALPEIWNPVEVGSLIEATDRMRVQLRDHIEERATRLADEQRRAHELEIARQIQRSMLPAPPQEPLDGWCLVAAMLRPAREVGGDLYDFFLLDGHRLLFIIGDVTDKGVPAALLMARVTGLFRAIGRSGTGPDGILRELDSRLSEGNDACMFVTAACGELDGETGEIRYAGAGHDRPVLRRRDGSAVVLELEGGPALGLAVNLPFPLWIGHLAPGDALVLCTDGVTEAFDAGGTAFGLDGFCRVVAGTPDDGLGALPDRLADAVGHFAEGGGPPDDLAVLAVQYRPPDVEMPGADAWRWAISRSPDGAAAARRRIQAILRARGVPAATVEDCSRVVDDALSQLARRGRGDGPARDLRVEVRLLPGEIQLRFEDSGVDVLTACWSRPAGPAEPAFKEAP